MRLALALVPLTLVAEVAIERTPSGIRYGVAKPAPDRRAPTVFFFAGSAEQSLSEERFVACQKAFGPEVLKVSIDLPGHGDDQRAGELGSLRTWRHRLDAGEDIIAATTRRATAVLDHLIAAGQADPERIAVFGTSRGGFMAFHWAAADKRVRRIAAFAPVTELSVLTEFKGMARAAANAVSLADRLHDRAMWLIIGNADDRVGTAETIAFVARVIETARQQAVKPRVELRVLPTEGHTIPDSSYLDAAAWCLRTF